MPRMIFVNLPVRDLDRSIAFYRSVGARKDPRFCDASACMMSLSDTIHIMLLTHARFGDFTPKALADPRTGAQVLLAITADSRDDVDATVARAVAAGAAPDPSPIDDYDFMYGRSFEDLDGHVWGINWMDVEAATAAHSAPAGA